MGTKPNTTDFIAIREIQFQFSDISKVIESFYRKVAQDPQLSVPFSSVDDWPHHIDRLTHFWWVRLGGTPYEDYFYNPPLKHFEAGFNELFLERWLGLFKETLGEHLTEHQALLWYTIADRMGFALNQKNEYLKQHYKLA